MKEGAGRKGIDLLFDRWRLSTFGEDFELPYLFPIIIHHYFGDLPSCFEAKRLSGRAPTLSNAGEAEAFFFSRLAAGIRDKILFSLDSS